MKEMNALDDAIRRHIALLCEFAVHSGYELEDFLQKWFSSDLMQKFVDYNYGSLSTGHYYQIHLLEEEYPDIRKKDYDAEGSRIYYENIAFWAGYLLTQWILTEEITGTEIYAAYDLSCLIDNYDVWHMMDVRCVIRDIKDSWKK